MRTPKHLGDCVDPIKTAKQLGDWVARYGIELRVTGKKDSNGQFAMSLEGNRLYRVGVKQDEHVRVYEGDVLSKVLGIAKCMCRHPSEPYSTTLLARVERGLAWNRIREIPTDY